MANESSVLLSVETIPRAPLALEPEVIKSALDLAVLSDHMKAAYFRYVGEHTRRNWTKVGFDDAGVRTVRHKQGIMRLCSCGDSISAEVANRFKAASFFGHVNTELQLDARECARWVDPVWSRSWKKCDLLIFSSPGIHPLSFAEEERVRMEQNFFANSPAAFWFEPSRRIRRARNYPNGPVRAHREMFRALVQNATKLIQRLKVPVFIVGTPALDAELLLLAPAMTNWDKFWSFAGASLFARAEASAWKQPSIEALRKTYRGWLFYIDMGALTQAYPGVRCDGLHYNSNYKYILDADSKVRCEASPALYDIAILQAILDGGSVLQASIAH